MVRLENTFKPQEISKSNKNKKTKIPPMRFIPLSLEIYNLRVLGKIGQLVYPPL
jgi:hypothetical protein